MARVVILITTCAVFGACSNDLEEVAALTSVKTMPLISIKNLETIYSDSAIVKVRLTAPEFKRYETPEKKIDEYPQGLKVEFFNKDMSIAGQITCESAVYYADNDLWKASNNVEAVNFANHEKINTELLYWDVKKETIYSDKFVRITTADEILFGDGFTSNQDFSAWKIINIKGTININDDEE